MINMKISKPGAFTSFEIQEKKKKLRRFLLRILAITLMVLGWSVPLLMIIHFLPNDLLLMFFGTSLIGIGFILQLLISSGEI